MCSDNFMELSSKCFHDLVLSNYSVTRMGNVTNSYAHFIGSGKKHDEK